MFRRKKGIGLLFSLILITVFFCGLKEVKADNFTLKEISEALKKHPDYSGKMRSPEIKAEEEHLTFTVKRGNKKTTLNFDLADNVLMGEFSGDVSNTASTYASYLIDAVGYLSGFQYGDMIKDKEYLKGASFEDNGFYYQVDSKSKSFKFAVDISGRIKKPDYNDSYIKTEDLGMLIPVLENNVRFTLSKGNIYVNVSGTDDGYEIIAAEKSGEYSINLNKSVCSVMEVLFDNKDVAYMFDSCYASFKKGDSSFFGFDVEVSPKLKKNEVSESVDIKNSFYTRIKMNSSEIKKSVKTMDLKRVFSWESEEKTDIFGFLKNHQGEILAGTAVLLIGIFFYVVKTSAKPKKKVIIPVTRNKKDDNRFNKVMGVAVEEKEEEPVGVDEAEELKWLSD